MQFQSEEEARRAKAEADLPPLPPLLAQILAETRAKQQAAKEGREYVPERKAGSDGNASDGEGQPPSGPLLLEGPSSGLVMQGTNVPDRQPGDSDSDSDAEPEAPLGPLDPARCRVHGPGFSGGAAGQPVKLTLTARDANGKRIREGGAHVLVMVEPPRAPGAQEEPDAIEAEVTDHGDGTYTVVYTVPAKGNYQLHIEVDGEPVGDSPYPVFFSAAKLVTESGAGPAGGVAAAPGQPAAAAQPGQAQLPAPVTTAGGFQVVTAQSIKAAQAQSQTQLGAAAAAGDVGAGVALAAGFPAGAAPQSSLGADMVRSGVAFPPIDAEQLQRMVLVGGVMPLVTPDALKSVFSHAGAIVNCQLVPPSFALVAFSSIAEAANALTIGGASLMGQPLRVELAVEAKQAADAALAAHNPYAALQAQQLAHFQMLQQQQAALAQQVATMRAAQRTGVQLPLDQRIVLKDQKEANGSERRRSRSRSRDRGGRRRSRSRERDGRSSRRSRSRERDGRSSRRSRSRERERGGRRRSRSRDRKRSHRSRSRERGSRHKEHKHKHHKRSRRSRSRDRKEDKSAGGEKAEGDAAAAAQQQAAAAAGGNKDDLEALLDEFEG